MKGISLKGISPLISTVLIILFISTASILVITIAVPVINRAKETAAINEVGVSMRTLDVLIKEVASEGVGSFRSMELKVSDGNYRIFNYSGNNTGAVEYRLEAKYSTLPLFSVVREGNVKYSTAVSTKGLVGYWKFDLINSSNYTSDYSGKGNDGLLYNFNSDPVVPIAGKYGNALSFDGSDDYVEVADSSSLDITNTITISAWINGTYTGNHHVVRKLNDTSQGVIYLLRVNGSGILQPALNNGTPYTIFNSTNSLQNNTWYHVAFTYDGNNVKIFINGVLDSTTSYTGNIVTSGNVLRIGRGDPADYFNGTIDNVKIWDRALTAEEIKTDFDPKQSDYQVVLEYDKIYLQGTDRFGKGSQRACIEKMGTEANKTVVKITKCG
jgi:hypothetical protein